MIVETVKIGNATIYVDDDCYKDKTKEEMQACINACFKVELAVLARLQKDKTA